MTLHRLAATPETTTDVIDPEATPVLTVDPGDTVVVDSLDANGYLDRPDAELDGARLIPHARGHCLTGPIAVRGARPGTFLAVRFESIVPGEWGWTVAGGRGTWLEERLGVADRPSRLLWMLDADAGRGTDQHGRTVRLAPFLGVVGLAPAEPGQHSTIPPRQGTGGNIDCRDLTAGSTLFLPVTVPGALLTLGDGHAAQGHGEVGGTAVECPMTTTLRLDLVPSAPTQGVHAITPTERITFGFDANLNEATAEALAGVLDWLGILLDIPRAEALALASAVVDLRVTQVANGTWGVHAALAHGALSGIPALEEE